MLGNGDHTEANIKVFGPRGGQYALREWKRRQDTPDKDITVVKQVMDTACHDRDDIALGHDMDTHETGQPSAPLQLPALLQPSAPPQPSAPLRPTETTYHHQDPSMAPNVEVLSIQVTSLTSLVETLVGKFNDSEINHRRQMEMIMKENTEWRRVISEMSQNISNLSWKSFQQPSKSVLIGSSLIRDIDANKLVDTSVVCKPGAKIKDIHNIVTNELDTEGIKSLTIVVGGNDCDSIPPIPADKIVETYSNMIDDAKSKARSVIVSSVCPRLKSPEVIDKITAVNAGLQVVCETKGVTFADSTSSFYLQDGSINDGYLLQDGVHLTHRATNKLAQHLNVHIKDRRLGVCSQKQHKNKEQNNTTRNSTPPTSAPTNVTPAPTNNNNAWTTVKGRQTQRTERTTQQERHTEQAYCFFCGEQGHSTDTCRHGKKIECNTCHRVGHKARLCHLY